MDTFLKQIALRIVTEHPKDTDRVLVVFNNNRSKRFFTKQFSTLGRASFLPQVLAIDEFISQLGGLEIVPNEFLLFELYNIHVTLGGEERKYQSFEDFISFGDMMMRDFSEIDQYLVDARLIFDNLHNLKAIGEWDIEGSGLSDFQRQYLEFYRSLYSYYTLLHERLLTQGKAYSGMAYREVAEHIGELWSMAGSRWTDIYFVGFNALSKCEETIIGEFVGRGMGHLLCDSDVYYLQPHQEAGYFLNKHMGDFPELRPSGPSLFGIGEKHITIVDCPENILQCKYTGQLLSRHPEWLDPKEAESTAIVLANESLLIPTLNALPDTTQPYSVNITMGYAYSNSMVHTLIEKIFALYHHYTPRGYYHSTLLELFSDRFVNHLLGTDNLRHSTEHLLRRDNLIRCTSVDIESLLHESGAPDPQKLIYLFPDHKPTPTECLVIFRQLATDLVNSDLLEKNLKEKQAVGSLAEVLENLSLLNDTYPYIDSTETLERIYTRIAQRHAISLRGEPLTGLQILGMLETRNLDFKCVILLSANEGVLPSGRGDNTLIPNELKIHFGMPTYVEKDSVYAHHFYRLLQRAERVYLLFNSENEGMGKGEASRFIQQVESELAPQFNLEVTREAVKSDASLTVGRQIPEAVKSDKVMQRLREMGEHGLSPTSFVDYMECPLKYYYTRVLSIGESEEIDEDLDASQLGDCVHKVLENILKPHCGKPLTKAVLDEALEQLPTHMENAFQQLYSGGRNTEGRNRFLYSVADAQLRHILQNELAHIGHGEELIINAVEETITNYPLIDGVNLKGKIDRIDTLGGHLRIIDYKTGRFDKKDITYHDGDEKMPSKWFQLMWYALLYIRKEHSSPDSQRPSLKVGIYPLRNLRSDVKIATWNDNEEITPIQLEHFEDLLKGKAAELMDPASAFLPSPSKAACLYCPAKTYCNYTSR